MPSRASSDDPPSPGTRSPDAIARPELTVFIPTHDNLPILRECLASWRRHADGQPVEVVVIEDGCTDGTAEFLAEQAATEWGRRHLRWVHTDDVHELMCTNRGLAEARAPLAMSWHDDMFLQAGWFVPELVRTFAAYPEIGLLCLSRGLNIRHLDAPLESWHDTVDWARVQSTIGPAPWNWARIYEVDAVIRPWVVRTACTDRVGALDEAFRPTEWDEADLAYRIRAAGWKVATHGYERGGAYRHEVSSTLSRTPSEKRMALGLRNARIFFGRWSDAIRAEQGRRRASWPRKATAAGWLGSARAALRQMGGRGEA
ncbi:MAG TPA: glycosyltransferase [Longimicrobiaceae bacterium]|nr:glycosyltransferase [Longimicrobiaceae bacterium]